MQDGNPQDPAQHALEEQRQEEMRANRNREQRARQDARDDTGGSSSALRPDNDDLVSEASDESFPASDPPSWTRVSLTLLSDVTRFGDGRA